MARGAALVLGSVMLLAGHDAAAQYPSSRWRPDERVVVGDYGVVLALAGGRELLYAFTEDGIGVYDARLRRWELPLPLPPGFLPPPGSPAIVDPMDRSAWLGTLSGLLHYDPRLDLVETVSIPGGVSGIMFDRHDTFVGLYVRTRFGWQLVQRGSGIVTDAPALPPPQRQVRATTVESVMRRDPGLAARSPLALTDERMRDYRYTAAAELEYTEDLFLGTDGLGVLHVDPVTRQFERLPFGLLDREAATIAIVDEQVVVGTSGHGRRVGFTFMSADLQRFAYEEGPPATGFRFRRILDVADDGAALLAATDRGVWRVGEDGRAVRLAPELIGEGIGAYAVARTDAGMWAGTERGLLFVDDAGDGMLVDARVREPVYALLVLADTVWLGGVRGMAFVAPGSDSMLVPATIAEDPWMRDPVVALAHGGGVLVAATTDRIAWRHAADGWRVERSLAGEVGRIVALAGDEAGVWILGSVGAVHFVPDRATFPQALRRDDFPGEPWDVVADGRYLWIATDRGVVRFEQRVLQR
jgi:hypothetical protein